MSSYKFKIFDKRTGVRGLTVKDALKELKDYGQCDYSYLQEEWELKNNNSVIKSAAASLALTTANEIAEDLRKERNRRDFNINKLNMPSSFDLRR